MSEQCLYTDGGVVGVNPSPIGGTWAWVLVETPDCDDPDCHRDPLRCDQGRILASDSGFIPPTEGPVSNNVAEYLAAVKGLGALPVGWSGRLCCDSQVTLGRLFQGWPMRGIPDGWKSWGLMALANLGNVEPVLLQGHPTKADLERGVGAKRKLPVSKWNVLCDKRCQEEAARAKGA